MEEDSLFLSPVVQTQLYLVLARVTCWVAFSRASWAILFAVTSVTDATTYTGTYCTSFCCPF